MKKNRMMRLASIMLVLVLMTSSVVGGTFAKYTSSATGSDTARVAKWNVIANDVVLGSASKEFTFDVFNTIKDTAGANEENVVAGLIAPGTSGSFDVVVKNFSEVDARFKVDFTTSNTNIPLKYTVKVNGAANSTGLANVGFTDLGMSEAATVTVEWEWTFEDNRDVADTELGLNPETVTVTANVTIEQVD